MRTNPLTTRRGFTTRLLGAGVLLAAVLPAHLFARRRLRSGGGGIPIHAILKGRLMLTPSTDGSVVAIEAFVEGNSQPFGRASAEAKWTTAASRLADLQSGVLSEITIGSGTLVVAASGAVGEGTFSGKLTRLPSRKIRFESDFVAELDVPFLGPVPVEGIMSGQADPKTLAFRFAIEGASL